uniref:Secreted protein n=1 Tax=Achlya hypogyna TaxID=1202772 RepID=A0A0A7CMP0_ACHHY|nr:secreted protein [Achlya hypogyna]
MTPGPNTHMACLSVLSSIIGALATTDEQKARLNALGFVWRSSKYCIPTYLDALRAFRERHGHVQVPFKFQVPVNDPSWPEHTRGIKLGILVRNLRRRKDCLTPEVRDSLNAIDFVWVVRPLPNA